MTSCVLFSRLLLALHVCLHRRGKQGHLGTSHLTFRSFAISLHWWIIRIFYPKYSHLLHPFHRLHMSTLKYGDGLVDPLDNLHVRPQTVLRSLKLTLNMFHSLSLEMEKYQILLILLKQSQSCSDLTNLSINSGCQLNVAVPCRLRRPLCRFHLENKRVTFEGCMKRLLEMILIFLSPERQIHGSPFLTSSIFRRAPQA